MSEEALETWEKVVEKGAEKIKRFAEASVNDAPEGFKKLHSEYVAYLKKIAEVTKISEEALDECFFNKYMESKA